MTAAEALFEIVKYFFSSLWVYLGLIVLILTIRGDISRGITGARLFFVKVWSKYREQAERIEKFREQGRGKG